MKKYWVGAVAPVFSLFCTAYALADDAPAADAGPPGFKISGHIEAGITGNPESPGDGLNFGQLFTDKSNQLLVNQALLTAEQPLDPKATGYDFGFRIQAMVGTDARYTHFLGELDKSVSGRYQLDLVEANVQAHLPWVSEGGVDVKLGQYATPIGFEVIDATGNPFYSHSYIFNFGIPLKHTGGYATAHLSDTLDLYFGGDTGVNTSLGVGDNNDEPAFLGGFGLNGLLDGKLTVLALTHIGPENPTDVVGFNANSALRYIGDVVITYKESDALSYTTELNYIRDDGFKAQAFGAAQYVSYTYDDTLTLNGRAEVFRDDNGFFVAAFPNPGDFVNAERGLPGTIIGVGAATYGALTAGVSYKPAMPDNFPAVMLRPELRWDHAFSDTKAFDAGTDTDQVTLAVDLVVSF
jgi:Putative beta-barrel porin-2, OmpL-like. bbp2